MLEVERHEKILKELEKKGRLSYKEIEVFLMVSIATIRRDVEKLKEEGLLEKVSGGVLSRRKMSFESGVSEKFYINIDEKKIIAKKAAKLVKNGDFIYMDAGTTVYYMIQYLGGKEITVVTNGLMHLEALISQNINTIITGGEIKPSTRAVVGSEALKNVEKYRFDKCFMGTNGLNMHYGYMTPDINEANMKRTVIEISNEAYILADSQKFGELSSIKFADLEQCKIITGNRIVADYSKFPILD